MIKDSLYFLRYSYNYLIIPLILLYIHFFFKDYKYNKIFGKIGIILILYFIYFHRVPNPLKTISYNKNNIYSPTYGTLKRIKQDHKYYYLQIFLSPMDPHLQYSPTYGTVTYQNYVKGEFNKAYLLDKSKNNERLYHTIENDKGKITFIQIAGLLARRLVKFINVGDKVNIGNIVGFITFSSRVDVVLEKDKVELLAKVGDKLKGPNTIIAKYT
jgi:phosphatidylserine decarboxylase